LEPWVVVVAVGSILVREMRWRRDGLLAPEEVGEGRKLKGDGEFAASDQTLLDSMLLD
jgi:hypothetical protein